MDLAGAAYVEYKLRQTTPHPFMLSLVLNMSRGMREGLVAMSTPVAGHYDQAGFFCKFKRKLQMKSRRTSII